MDFSPVVYFVFLQHTLFNTSRSRQPNHKGATTEGVAWTSPDTPTARAVQCVFGFNQGSTDYRVNNQHQRLNKLITKCAAWSKTPLTACKHESSERARWRVTEVITCRGEEVVLKFISSLDVWGSDLNTWKWNDLKYDHRSTSDCTYQ